MDDDSDDESQGSHVIGFSWTQLNKSVNQYDENIILLDTGSTFSVLNNPKMLLNIRRSKRTVKSVHKWRKTILYTSS